MYSNSIHNTPAEVRDFALTTLRVLPREIVQQGGSTYWLEPAEPLACDRVITRRGDMAGRQVLRELKNGQVYNHWTHLVTV